MASSEGLVPITRAFLSKFYDKYPLAPISPDLIQTREKLKSFSQELESAVISNPDEESFISKYKFAPPHKMDENLWKNREQIEEILFLLNQTNWPQYLTENSSPFCDQIKSSIPKWSTQLEELFKVISTYQTDIKESIFDMVLSYLPQDFRGSLVKHQRERSERLRQSEVENLLANGGTIAQKYELLWKHQMDRRKSLASLGNATGIFKTIVTYLAGCPQVLLDFVKTINDHDGPMDEQRSRYGPFLCELTDFINSLRVFIGIWWKMMNEKSIQSEDNILLFENALNIYASELQRFIRTIKEVFDNSPFLITASEAISAGGETFLEVTVANGYKHEVKLPIDSENLILNWEFELVYGKDVGFSIDFVDSNGNKTGMVPYQRIESHKGSFKAPGIGLYYLIWDNSYSLLTRKTIKFKAGTVSLDAPLGEDDVSVRDLVDTMEKVL